MIFNKYDCVEYFATCKRLSKAFAGLSYSIPIKHLQSNITINANLSDIHTVGFINAALNGTSSYNIVEGFTRKSNLKKHIMARISLRSAYNLVQYSAAPLQKPAFF